MEDFVMHMQHMLDPEGELRVRGLPPCDISQDRNREKSAERVSHTRIFQPQYSAASNGLSNTANEKKRIY
jgi:hypothetical protein